MGLKLRQYSCKGVGLELMMFYCESQLSILFKSAGDDMFVDWIAGMSSPT